MTMLTEKAREIFSELVDLNHDCNILRGQLAMKEEQLEEVKELLIAEIGENNYHKFIAIGRTMFSAHLED